MAGAGISTSAGIPDFRSPVTGLYASLAKHELPHPEALFDIHYFRQNPQPFYTLYKELFPDGVTYLPTLTHCFFTLLEKKGRAADPVDTLERLVGLSPDRLVEAHGSFATARCVECKTEVDQAWLKAIVKEGNVAQCPRPSCRKNGKRHSIKPDITCTLLHSPVFGENLPERFFKQLADFRQAQALLVMGTSLVVNPFASLIDQVPAQCPRFLFNMERVGEGSGDRGFHFTQESHDTFCQGDVDTTVRILARKCGWEDELDTMYKAMVERLQPEEVRASKPASKGETQPASPSEASPSHSPTDKRLDPDSLAEELGKVEIGERRTVTKI